MLETLSETPEALDGAEFDPIAADLAQRGWSVTDDFVSPLLVSQLGADVRRDWDEGRFRHAGVGRGADFEIKPQVRTDRVSWLDGADCSGAQRIYLNHLERLRRSLNRNLFLGLFEFEGHAAIYPPGTYYRKHLDQFRGASQRTVTTILYLNPGWCAADGGQLRMYTDQEDPGRYEEILPVAGRLVTFLSARYLHEVMPATRDRLSITGWFKCR